MTLQELIKEGESKTLEFKETLPKNDSTRAYKRR